MGIEYQILGEPDRDNALFVGVNHGQGIERLLFDCGDGCLSNFTVGQIQDIDALFFSHLHMDHVCGFDQFFRCNFARANKPNVIWGPPETARIIRNRMAGYIWNLLKDTHVSWWIHEIRGSEIKRFRCELHEGFEVLYQEDSLPLVEHRIVDTQYYTITAVPMDHRTISMTYIVREKPKQNIETSRLKDLGLRPGPWLQQVKQHDVEEGAQIEVQGEMVALAEIREKLLVESPGDSIAYLTDFMMGKPVGQRLIPMLEGCQRVVCESQYAHRDLELARTNYHMTARQVGKIAKLADVEELILFHLSIRYTQEEWLGMLQEAQAEFPNTRFPKHWNLGA